MDIIKIIFNNYLLYICTIDFVILLSLFALYVGFSDYIFKGQIQKDLEKKGGKLISIDIIHKRGSIKLKVRYIDLDQKEHIGTYMPSFIFGSYWLDDNIVENRISKNNS
jgi:hypothetical protein